MIYESTDDRRAQHEIASIYAARHQLDFWLTDRAALLPWDAEFIRGDLVVSIAEIKRRHVTRWTFNTFKVDRVKVDALIAAAAARGVAAGILIGFNDGIVKLAISRDWLRAHATPSVILRRNRDGETPDPAYEWSNDLWTDVDRRDITPAVDAIVWGCR